MTWLPPKSPLPSTITLEVRIPTYEFQGDTNIQSIEHVKNTLLDFLPQICFSSSVCYLNKQLHSNWDGLNLGLIFSFSLMSIKLAGPDKSTSIMCLKFLLSVDIISLGHYYLMTEYCRSFLISLLSSSQSLSTIHSLQNKQNDLFQMQISPSPMKIWH